MIITSLPINVSETSYNLQVCSWCVRLSDRRGRVKEVGGMGVGEDLSSVEVFSPWSGAWASLDKEMREVNTGGALHAWVSHVSAAK